MSPTLLRSRSAPTKNLGRGLMVSAGVAAIVVVAAVLAPGMRLPKFVSRITVANPSQYGVEVEVMGSELDGALDLGGFPRESARSVYQVIDEGDRWLFRFRYAGQDVAALTMTRAELKRSNWQVSVPREVNERLLVTGVTPSARG